MFSRAILRTIRSPTILRCSTPRSRTNAFIRSQLLTARPTSTLSPSTPNHASGAGPASSPIAKRQKLELHTSATASAAVLQGTSAGMTNADQSQAGEGPAGWKESVKDYGSYKLLQSFPIKYAPVGVGKWKSEKTGLTVVVGSHEGASLQLCFDRLETRCTMSERN